MILQCKLEHQEEEIGSYLNCCGEFWPNHATNVIHCVILNPESVLSFLLDSTICFSTSKSVSGTRSRHRIPTSSHDWNYHHDRDSSVLMSMVMMSTISVSTCKRMEIESYSSLINLINFHKWYYWRQRRSGVVMLARRNYATSAPHLIYKKMQEWAQPWWSFFGTHYIVYGNHFRISEIIVPGSELPWLNPKNATFGVTT